MGVGEDQDLKEVTKGREGREGLLQAQTSHLMHLCSLPESETTVHHLSMPLTWTCVAGIILKHFLNLLLPKETSKSKEIEIKGRISVFVDPHPMATQPPLPLLQQDRQHMCSQKTHSIRL
jgi:hypothetical protein